MSDSFWSLGTSDRWRIWSCQFELRMDVVSSKLSMSARESGNQLAVFLRRQRLVYRCQPLPRGDAGHRSIAKLPGSFSLLPFLQYILTQIGIRVGCTWVSLLGFVDFAAV